MSIVLNCGAMVPKKYKENVIRGMIYQIYSDSSMWTLFHEGIEKDKRVWNVNNYPVFYTDIVLKMSLDAIKTKNTNKEGVFRNSTEDNIKYLF